MVSLQRFANYIYEWTHKNIIAYHQVYCIRACVHAEKYVLECTIKPPDAERIGWLDTAMRCEHPFRPAKYGDISPMSDSVTEPTESTPPLRSVFRSELTNRTNSSQRKRRGGLYKRISKVSIKVEKYCEFYNFTTCYARRFIYCKYLYFPIEFLWLQTTSHYHKFQHTYWINQLNSVCISPFWYTFTHRPVADILSIIYKHSPNVNITTDELEKWTINALK